MKTNLLFQEGFGIGSFIIVIALVLAGAAGVYFYAGAPSDGSGTPPPTATPGPITIIGEITCLPHRGDGPTTLECAFGLAGDDGKNYGLRDIPQERFVSGEINVGKRVRVIGTVRPPEANERYDIAGIIAVTDIRVEKEVGGGNIPLQAEFATKVVYTTDQSVDVAALRADCWGRNGTFNECGTVCSPDAETCVAVCAFTCEFR